MTQKFDITAVGHAIVDVQAASTDAFLDKNDLHKGAMTLIDQHRATSLLALMADTEMASGGSAGNTIAGAASFGAACAYIGKVAHDALGEVFSREMKAQGVHFSTEFLHNDPTHTGSCMINVTPDGQRTMATFLGAAALVGPEDIDKSVIEASQYVYLEGYLFDTPSGREAFAKAAQLARKAGRKTAITLSDMFVVSRWREDLLAFIERHIDLVFANEAELSGLYQTDDFDAALRAARPYSDYLFVTRSEKGSVAVFHDQVAEVAAYPVAQVVDTTGAGDQYAAGALFGLSRGLDLKTCAQLGSLAASEVIAHFGPRPHVSLAELAKQQNLIS